MKKRRESENNMMEEAIQKASQLISLLQKENTQLKKRVDTLEKQLEKSIIANQQLKKFNRELEQETINLENHCNDIQSQMEKIKEGLTKSQQNLKRKTTANKELHQKISVLNGKLKDKNKSTIDEKTKMLSLQNQNEYLLKKLKEYQDKQNSGVQKINQKYIDYQNQIKEILRLKEAFSRRCQQLKADNLVVTQKAAQYKQKLLQAENYILRIKRLQQNPKRLQQLKIQENIIY